MLEALRRVLCGLPFLNLLAGGRLWASAAFVLIRVGAELLIVRLGHELVRVESEKRLARPARMRSQSSAGLGR